MDPWHYLSPEGARPMQTAQLLLAQRAIADLLKVRAMGVLHGHAGTGKTFAARMATAQLPDPVCWVQFPSRPTMLHVAQRLLEELTGEAPKGSRFALSDRLCRLLADRPRLICVDEAQWLNRECIEYLRHLHDQPVSRFGLLLVGGDGCWEVLSREPMLRSRIYRRVQFSAMDTATVVEVIPGYHPLYEHADAELIAFIDDCFCHGNFRSWAIFTATAIDLGVTPINEATARTVFGLLGGGEQAA